MVHLTVIHGEKVAMLDIGPDMALQDFIALVQMEIEELSGVAAEKFRIVCNGNAIRPSSSNLQLPIEVRE